MRPGFDSRRTRANQPHAVEYNPHNSRTIWAMATVTRTFMVDDIDGSQDDVSTVQIALDSVSYEIDLSADNAALLREKLARFVDNGKKVTTHPRGRKQTSRRVVTSAPVGREQAQAVRDWARNNGYTVSERGRIPKNVQEAFENAH